MTKTIVPQQKAGCNQGQGLLSDLLKLYNLTLVGLQTQITEISSGNWYFKCGTH